ncbi:MAG: GFA family protein [Myxococcota bacterium]
MLTGRCQCAGVRFSISGKLGPAGLCHCEQCRRANGSAFAANAPVRTQYFKIEEGLELLREFESSPNKFRAFCSRCGSPIYSRHDSEPDIRRVRLGTLDGDPGRQPLAHLWVSDKASWYTIDADLPKFAEGPDGPLA